MPGTLTDAEIDQFRRLGYVVKEGVYSAAAMQPIKDSLSEIIDREALALQARGELDDVFAGEPFETRLAEIRFANPAACEHIYRAIMGRGGGGFHGPPMLAFLRHAPLLSCIEGLIGSDIIGSSVYRIRPKLPQWDHGEVPWHQDSGYLLAHCDVYLMWPETKDQLAERMKAVHAVAENYNRTLDYGLRVHMIVRDTEAEAQEYADYIVSKLDDDYGRAIRERALDATSLGVAHQAKNRDLADEYGYVEPGLWTGVGRARSGCGAALVGSTDQVMTKIEEYQKMGIRAFIFSGYPHMDECKYFGEKVLPQLKTCSLPHAYGRVPNETPMTPLGAGERR